jgi:hypothetical protein
VEEPARATVTAAAAMTATHMTAIFIRSVMCACDTQNQGEKKSHNPFPFEHGRQASRQQGAGGADEGRQVNHTQSRNRRPHCGALPRGLATHHGCPTGDGATGTGSGCSVFQTATLKTDTALRQVVRGFLLIRPCFPLGMTALGMSQTATT